MCYWCRDWPRSMIPILSLAGNGILLAGHDDSLPLVFDRDKRCFTLPIPHQRPVPTSEEQVSLTLLRYDEQMKGERYLLFYGHMTETGKEWTFTPSQVVLRQWGRRA